VSDNFSASAAAQTKTIHLTTMANQYLDSRKTCRATVYDSMHIHADLTQNLKGKLVAEPVSGGAETILVDFDAITNEDELAATAVSDAQTAVNSATTARDDAVAAQGASAVTDLVDAATAAKTAWDNAVAAVATASAADPTVAAAKTDLDAAFGNLTSAEATIVTANDAQTAATAALAQALVNAQAVLDAAIDAAQEDVSVETTARNDAQADKDAGPTTQNDAVTAAILARDAAQATATTKAQEHTAAQALFLSTTPSSRNAEFNAHSAYNTAKAASDAAAASAASGAATAEAAKVAAEAQLATAQAAKDEVDARQVSRGADLPRKLNMTVDEDHYLKIKDNTDWVYGQVTDVKIIFHITPINSRTSESDRISKLQEMNTFYNTTLGVTKSQKVRFALKPVDFVHPGGYSVSGFDEVQSHIGYCPSNLVLSYTDGTSQTIDFGGSDSRRYRRADGDDSYAFEKSVYVKPLLDFSISATPNFPTVTSDFAWHAAMNFDRVKVDVFENTNVKAHQSDISTAQGFCPAIGFDETAYGAQVALGATTFKIEGTGMISEVNQTPGQAITADHALFNKAFFLASIANMFNISESAITQQDTAEEWSLDGSMTSPMLVIPGDQTSSLDAFAVAPLTFKTVAAGVEDCWYIDGLVISGVAQSRMYQMPVIADPALPALDGELTVSNSAYDNTTRTLTFDVTNTLSSQQTTHVSIYSYGDEKMSIIQRDSGHYMDLEPNYRSQNNFGQQLSEGPESIYYDTLDTAIRVSAIPGAFRVGKSVIVPDGHVEMGIKKNGEQKYIELVQGLGADAVSQSLVAPVGTSNHSIDLSGMPEYDLDLVAIVDGKFQHGTKTTLDQDAVIGAGGMIRDNIDDNLIFFTDGDGTKLEHNGTVYPSEPYMNPVILEEQLSPFGVSAIIGNTSLDGGSKDGTTYYYNDVYECSTEQVNLIQSWGSNWSGSAQPNTPGQVSGTYNDQTYYLNHNVNWTPKAYTVVGPIMMDMDGHQKQDTLVIPFCDLTPDNVYCHVFAYSAQQNYAQPVFKGHPNTDPLALPTERMLFFTCPNPVNGAGEDNLKIKIAMTNQAAAGSWPVWRTGKAASAENAFNAMRMLFPTVIYLEGESTYNDTTGDAVIIFNCPGANQTILTDGQAYKGTSAWSHAVDKSVADKIQGVWTVDQKVVTDMAEPAPNHIVRCFVSGDFGGDMAESYIDQSDPGASWQAVAHNARRIQTALTILNDQGFKNITVRKSGRDQHMTSRKLFVEQYDIALYTDDPSKVNALVGTDIWAGVKSASHSLCNFSTLADCVVLCHSVVAYEAVELPAIYGASADLRRWAIEFNLKDITEADQYNPHKSYHRKYLNLIVELNKVGLVDVSFGHGCNWENADGKFETYIECSATEAAMQNALDTFIFSDSGLVASIIRISKATNLTEMKRYKFELATDSWVNGKMWDVVQGGNSVPTFDPDFLGKDHPVWGIEGMADTFKAGFKRLGFSNIVLSAGSNGAAQTPLYKFSAEFDGTPGAVASAIDQKIYFGNEDPNAKMYAGDTQFMRVKCFDAGDFTITEVPDADATNLTASTATELVASPGIILDNAMLGSFAHSAGSCVTIQGALIKTDGVLAEAVDTNALVCYMALSDPSSTTGLSTVYVSPERMQGLDMGSIAGFGVEADGQVTCGGKSVYVVPGDTTGAAQLADLTGTSGTGYAVIDTAGVLLAPGISVYTVNAMNSNYWPGWKDGENDWGAGWSTAPENIKGLAPSLVLMDPDDPDTPVWEAPTADLKAIPGQGGTTTWTLFLPEKAYTIMGSVHDYTNKASFSVGLGGMLVVPVTPAGALDQAAADWQANKRGYAVSVAAPITLLVPNKYTVSTWDYYSTPKWREAWGAASVFRITDDDSNTILEVPSDYAGFTQTNANTLAGTFTLLFRAMPGTYNILVGTGGAVYPGEKSYAVWKGDLDRVAMFGDATSEIPVGAIKYIRGQAKVADATTGTIALN